MRNSKSTTIAPKAVLVTGCSSGIGRRTAILLSEMRFVVFATVRKETDAAELTRLGLPSLVPVFPLDLADRGQIARGAKQVAEELDRRDLRGLHGLVNNAGGGSPAPVELLDLDEFRTELEARVLGSVAMVQAFLPLLRQGGGRIIWIVTPALIPTTYVAGIHACDFAVNCIARTLDIELKPWKIRNVLIRCGGIKTRAGLRTTVDVERLLQEGPRERVVLYEEALKKWSRDMQAFDRQRTEPKEVARVVLRALCSARPKRRYSVGYMAGAARVLEAMPPSVTDGILRMRV